MVLKIKTLQAISDEYKVGKELGKGTYGTVNICSHNSTPQAADTVIKNIDLHKLKRKDIADLMKEAKLLQMFDHPNVTFEPSVSPCPARPVSEAARAHTNCQSDVVSGIFTN
jgi:serine/threonine protein kinase